MSAMGVALKRIVSTLHLAALFFVLVIYGLLHKKPLPRKQSFKQWLKTTVLYFPNKSAIWVESRRQLISIASAGQLI